jgi:hypothetical protein
VRSSKIHPFSLFALLVVSACSDTFDEPMSERAAAPLYWTDSICNEVQCYAAHPDAADLWVPVLSSEFVHQLYMSGKLIVDWPAGFGPGCGEGLTPDSLTAQCFRRAGTTEHVCYGGDSLWVTEVYPACDTGSFAGSTYAQDSCTTSVQAQGFDKALASPDVPNSALAITGGDGFHVLPACAVLGD